MEAELRVEQGMTRHPRESARPWLLAAALAALLCSGCGATLRPPVELSPAELARVERFDHALWAKVLAARVDERGRVDYAGLVRDRGTLDRYVALLGAIGPTTRPALFPTRADRLAYYLNAYNALVMFQVVERWPLTSVDDLSVRFFRLTELPLDGGTTTLHALENELIRPRFEEPRVHFALNCASRGCPRLPRQPFLPDRLEAQLQRETQRFLHERRNVRVAGDVVVLSQLFAWYAEDFPPTPLAWIARQAPDLHLSPGAEVEHTPWDWRLNDR